MSLRLQAGKADAAFELAKQGLANAKAEQFASAAAEATKLHEKKVHLDSELAKTKLVKEQLNDNIQSLEKKKGKTLLPQAAQHKNQEVESPLQKLTQLIFRI